MFTGTYSIGFKLANDPPVKAPVTPASSTIPAQQPGYHSVTLSAPPPAPPAPVGPDQADDDFFAEAFDGVAASIPGMAAPFSETAGDQTPGALRGYLEDCSPDRIAGWAQDERPGAPPVHVAILLGRIVLAELVADSWRADLSAAEIGTGHHAFEFRPGAPIARDLLSAVKVIRVTDKAELPRVFELVNQ
jgi:hypothetical protein